jgi:hypothetical protein
MASIRCKIMWSNIWLFNSIISKTMSLTAPMNAIIRTVHTVTDIHSDNVEAKTNKVPESFSHDTVVRLQEMLQ